MEMYELLDWILHCDAMGRNFRWFTAGVTLAIHSKSLRSSVEDLDRAVGQYLQE